MKWMVTALMTVMLIAVGLSGCTNATDKKETKPPKDTTPTTRMIASEKTSLPANTSFLWDQAKTYQYKLKDGSLDTWTYKEESNSDDFTTWQTSKKPYECLIKETEWGIFMSFYESEPVLHYPIQIGQKWGNDDNTYEITKIYDEVTLPSGAFKDVVEVTKLLQGDSKSVSKSYFAPNMGLILSVDASGKHTQELYLLK